MSSGYFDTIFFQKAVPLSNDVAGYSTLSLLAVGSNGYMENFTFYDYQRACGFSDTSTLTTALTSSFTSTIASVQSTTLSTFAVVNSNIDYNGKTYVSTIPFLQWISSTTVTDYPFYYPSTYTSTYTNNYMSTIYSTTSNVINDLTTYFTPTFVSTNTNSTFILNCISTPNVSTFISTILSGTFSSIQTFSSSFISSFLFSTFGENLVSSFVDIQFASTSISDFISTGVLATSYPYDFASTCLISYSSTIATSNIWLGEGLSKLINSGKYNVYVDAQVSAYISTTTAFTWISTLGVFNVLDDPSYTYGNKGVPFTTRLGNNQYSHLYTSIEFNPEPVGQRTQIPANASNFHLEFYLHSSITTQDPSPYMDVLVQGQKNITFTLVPIV